MPNITNSKEALTQICADLQLDEITPKLSQQISQFSIENHADFLKLLGFLYALSIVDTKDYGGYSPFLLAMITQFCDKALHRTDPFEKLIIQRSQTAGFPAIPRLARSDYTRQSESTLKQRLMFGLGHRFADHQISALHDPRDAHPRIYLGALPTLKKAFEIVQLFPNKNSNAIVSVLTDWELFGDAQFRKIDSTRAIHFFHSQDFNHFQIPFYDHGTEFHARDKTNNKPVYTPNEIAMIMKVLSQLQDIYQKNGNIYFHCKAGQGRSSFIAILFLALVYQPWQIITAGKLDISATILNVHKKVETIRPVVDPLNEYRLTGLTELATHYLQQLETTAESTEIDQPVRRRSKKAVDSTASEDGLVEKTKRVRFITLSSRKNEGIMDCNADEELRSFSMD